MDSASIFNLFNEQAAEPEVFADAQWGFIQDTNNNSYTNSINFVTSTLKQQLVDYHNAVITIPIQLTSSTGTPYAGNENIAFKQSVFDLIENLMVTTDQGQSIVNEQRTNYINNLRLNLEHNIDWDYMEGPSVDHCVDQWVSGDFSGPQGTATLAKNAGGVFQYVTNDPKEFGTQSVTGATPSPVTVVTGRNPLYNRGFDRRVKILRTTLNPPGTSTNGTNPVVSGFSGGAYNYHALIPLKHLHDLFMQLDFPIFNLGFVITLYLNQPSAAVGSTTVVTNSGYVPFMTDNNVANTTAGGITTPPPILTVNGGSNLGCRLYYRSVKLEPRENKHLAEMLATGFTKSIKFISTDYIVPAATPVAAGNNVSFSQVISTSTVQPLRVWMLGYPSDALARSDYASGVVPIRWSDANILVNQFPYFRQNINNGNNRPEDWWELYKEQCDPQLGSMVSYDEFMNVMNYCVFDVSRLSDRLQSPTQAVSLQVQANRQDKGTTTAAVTILIERMNQISIRFSDSGVNIVVGNIAGR